MKYLDLGSGPIGVGIGTVQGVAILDIGLDEGALIWGCVCRDLGYVADVSLTGVFELGYSADDATSRPFVAAVNVRLRRFVQA